VIWPDVQCPRYDGMQQRYVPKSSLFLMAACYPAADLESEFCARLKAVRVTTRPYPKHTETGVRDWNLGTSASATMGCPLVQNGKYQCVWWGQNRLASQSGGICCMASRSQYSRRKLCQSPEGAQTVLPLARARGQYMQ